MQASLDVRAKTAKKDCVRGIAAIQVLIVILELNSAAQLDKLFTLF